MTALSLPLNRDRHEANFEKIAGTQPIRSLSGDEPEELTALRTRARPYDPLRGSRDSHLVRSAGISLPVADAPGISLCT
jgi:hypothetical protein